MRRNISKLKNIIQETIHNVKSQRKNVFLKELKDTLMMEKATGGKGCVKDVVVNDDGSGSATGCRKGCWGGCGRCDCIDFGMAVQDTPSKDFALNENKELVPNSISGEISMLKQLNENEIAAYYDQPGATFESLIRQMKKARYNMKHGIKESGCKSIEQVVNEQRGGGRIDPRMMVDLFMQKKPEGGICIDKETYVQDGRDISWGPTGHCGGCPGCGPCGCAKYA